MGKEEIYQLLKDKGIWHEITEHEAVFNMEELDKIELPYKGCDAKNLFVRDDKKRAYYLITVKGDKRVNLKEFRNRFQTRPLTFASEEDLSSIMNLYAGAVSPLGLLNDKELKVTFYLDKDFEKGKKVIGIHPNDNTATVWLKSDDLAKLIEETGHTVQIISI